MKTAVFTGMLFLMFLCPSPADSVSEPLVVVQPIVPVVQPAQERALLVDLNTARVRAGLAPLVLNERLSLIAKTYAQDMAHRRFFGHVSPDGGSLVMRLRSGHYAWQVAAENLAFDTDESHAHAALWNSPEHRSNILDARVRDVGVAVLAVGVDCSLYVEDFGLAQ